MLFSLEPMGNIGNRLLEYMAALAVSENIPEKITINCDLHEIGIEFDEGVHKKILDNLDDVYCISDTDLVSPKYTAELIRNSGKKTILFKGYYQRYNLYLSNEYYRKKFSIKKPLDIDPFDKNDMVINIRGGEILSGAFQWYPLVPVNFYEQLIRTTRYNPVFIGQLEDSSYTRAIKSAFPGARMIPSGGAMVDFNRLMHAPRLCVTVSTFSWLAAWLSDAHEIHYPLLGFLHPFCMPDKTHGLGGIDLTPLGDHRYRYHLFPVLNATPVEDYLRFTGALNPVSRAVSSDFVRNLCQTAKDSAPSISVTDNWYYIQRYIDAAWSISSGEFLNSNDHYDFVGKFHGYSKDALPPVPRTENLALGKPATQSSVSAWSRAPTPEDDAAGAVDGVLDGTSFHTDMEDQPWWRVDLTGSAEISEIRIFNRIENYIVAGRSKSLMIEVADHEDEYREIFRYTEEFSFGGSDGKPLIFRPVQRVVGRFVRIKLMDTTYLHLEQVEIYGRML